MITYSIINCILYVIAITSYYHKRKAVDVYCVILFAYTLTAIMCMLNLKSMPKAYPSISLIPFIYMFICVLIFISPYKDMKVGGRLLVVENTPIKILTCIYILSGFVAIYYTLPDAIELIRSGEWGVVRQLLYADEENIELYHSLPEKFAKNIHSYLEPFGIVMCFYYLAQENKKPFTILCIFTSFIGYGFLSATLIASRGMVVNFMLQLVLCYFIFKDLIGEKMKRRVGLFAVLLSIPLILYLFAVSISRFGEDSAGSSMFDYLGHSMLNFNQGVMGTMHDYAYGKYFFEFFIKTFGLGSPVDLTPLGYTGGSGFYTFIGDIYIDWGPIGTILIALCMSVFLRRFTRKKIKHLSDFVIIIFFANFFMNGVFVIGRGAAISWIMCGVVYIIVKIIEKKVPLQVSLRKEQED